MHLIAAGFLIGLLILLAGCSSATPRCTCPCHDRHAAAAGDRRSAPTTSPIAANPSGSYRPPLRTGDTGYVRLRGSRPIHVPDCPMVRKARPDGITPAARNDGPPCFTCRRAEALAAER